MFWVAALRETFEEAGILLARRPGDERLVDLSVPELEERFNNHRAGVNSGEVDFVDMVRQEGLVLDGTGVHYVSRWVTPLGPPRRYDTRFFVTAMPEGQQPLHDDDEAVHHQWMRPAEALALNETDEMLMMTPTVSMLGRLARYDNTTEAIAAAVGKHSATRRNGAHQIRIEGPGRIAWPDDPDYRQQILAPNQAWFVGPAEDRVNKTVIAVVLIRKSALVTGTLNYRPPWRNWIAQRASIPTVAGSSPAGGATVQITNRELGKTGLRGQLPTLSTRNHLIWVIPAEEAMKKQPARYVRCV